MSPEKRRASIVEAALPLIRRHGDKVTTGQIAKAAGLAEGTLFRAFRDKPELVNAALCAALDPAPAEAKLRAIDPDLALRDKLVAAIAILAQRIEQVWQVMSMLGRTMPPPERARSARGRRGQPTDDPGAPVRVCLTEMLETHRDELRYPPEKAARLVHAMAFAGTHPRLAGPRPLSAPDVASVLLDGIRVRSKETT
jgi:AcrR family transcriptional regulator